ncbi:palmitoyltransferase PFA4 [Panaeolus papilionaceus]|nr:palmitoyltransferase PFA4 [Panaeolus papilionaceus]
MHPFFGRLIVNFVLLLICFIAYSSQIFIIWPWYGTEWSIELLTLLVPFNFLVGMLFWNYFLCVNLDPGAVPEGWVPDTTTDGYEVKKLTGAPRYCRMCKQYKPPRTHHCRTCNRCVLRMDHHCPWINNCVGHRNHGHFIRFLFFVDLACSYHFAMVTRRVMYQIGTRDWDEPSPFELVMIILNYVTCIPVLLAVGGFSLYHFWSLMRNTTTIEGWEKDKVSLMVRKGKTREIKFPYDLGMRKNIDSVLGKNPLLWCCPYPTPGDGLQFELSNKDGQPWPPKEEDVVSPSLHDPEVIRKSSPWTFESESLNPNLRPSNSEMRNRRKKIPGSSTLPPYHPDYQEEESESDSASDSGHQQPSTVRVRRGSEGYEVRPAGREEMLQRYLEELGEPDRYVRYVPEVQYDEDSEEDPDDNIPLAYHVENKKVASPE